MKNLITVLCFIIFSSMAYAGPGEGSHSHGPANKVSPKEVVVIGKQLLENLSKANKLAPSWGKIETEEKVEEVKLRGQLVWRATFNNQNIKDPSKNKIYTFISPNGQVIGASFEADPQSKGHSHGGENKHTH